MRGFTLLELLVAITIVGVLSVMALPGYQGVRHRTQRTDARLALLWIQYQQERHYAAHNTYAAALSDLVERSSAGDYDIGLTINDDGQGYVATAHAHAGGRQAGDRPCRWFSINESGLRRAATAAGIWSDDDPNRCWS
jgi:type IV pilus assembly protein PilE